MAVMLACGASVIIALVCAWRWRGLSRLPVTTLEPEAAGARYAARVALREIVIVIAAGMASGLLFVGPASRLAMRLLAVTGGDAAQNRITEAGEVVGRITVGGTIGLVVFVGLGAGLISSAVHGLLRGVRPAGLLGGVVTGVLLLIVLGPTVDPIRPDNVDFRVVGPGWLALLVFLAMAVAQGVLLATYQARLSHLVPLLSRRWMAAAWLLVLLPILVTGIGAAVLLVVGASALIGTRTSLVHLLDGAPVRRTAQVGLGLVVMVSLPGLVRAVVEIGSM